MTDLNYMDAGPLIGASIFIVGVGIYFAFSAYHVIRYYRILRLVKKTTPPLPLLGVVTPPTDTNNKDVH
jgi:uncharacterized membrane protein